jgi:hypothetical protein
VLCGGAGGNRTPVQQSVNGCDTTIPALSLTLAHWRVRWRSDCSDNQRLVFPKCQRSFSPSAFFLAVIPHFCCRAVMDWPRAALLLTMTLHYEIRSQGSDQAARVNCLSAILFVAPFSESEQLGSQTRPTVLMSKPVSPLKRYVADHCTTRSRKRVRGFHQHVSKRPATLRRFQE